eukprot:symbB.v1.2.002767.t1/scaffold141.1/size300911/18
MWKVYREMGIALAQHNRGRGKPSSIRWYRRHLWKSEFPSDLPPALRQNAAVIRHAAPEAPSLNWMLHQMYQ